MPAFTDSELGLDVRSANRMREAAGRHKLRFDPFEDLEHFAVHAAAAEAAGHLYHRRRRAAQLVAAVWAVHRAAAPAAWGRTVPLKRYHYGLRICPEPVYWGGLSGSPYSEAISWGKFVPPAEGGKFGEVFVDATVGLPLIVAAVLERLGKNGQNHKGKKEKALARK